MNGKVESQQKPVVKTNSAAIKNAVLLCEGNGYFSNLQYFSLVAIVPWAIQRYLLPFNSGLKTYLFILLITAIPTMGAYWNLSSKFGPRLNHRATLPCKPIEDYITINDPELKKLYHGRNKIPMDAFHDAYFEGKIDFKGDVLEIMELRHDWASFDISVKHIIFFFFKLIPDVLWHSREQDEDQVRSHYDRGDDFYGWFLGKRMIYTSGVIGNVDEKESLEKLQDNKLSLVCEKLDLKPTDKLLDIGCGWGTLTAFASKNYGCDATGITLSKNQAAFGNKRIQENGLSQEKARVLCLDYRDIPGQSYNKIVSLEMMEHIGLLRYSTALRQFYDILDDEGTFVLQVAGIRPRWQFEDLVWGLFMNKYVFPGADASCGLNWVVGKVEGAGFEVKNIDVLGVHYSATIWRWYQNWLSNEEQVKSAYGSKWFRIWSFFLAYSTIISRDGGASVFQITMHKNLNAFPRVEGIKSHTSIKLNERAHSNVSIE